MPALERGNAAERGARQAAQQGADDDIHISVYEFQIHADGVTARVVLDDVQAERIAQQCMQLTANRMGFITVTRRHTYWRAGVATTRESTREAAAGEGGSSCGTSEDRSMDRPMMRRRWLASPSR